MSEFFARAFADSETVRLVAEVPELFEHLPPRARHDARTRAVVPAMQLRRGHWDGQVPGARDVGGYLGLLVLEGTMLRNVHVARQPRSELVGHGDLARPWEHDGAAASLPFDADWRVLEPARLAVLDDRFLTVACRWPSVVSAILGRAVQRSHGLALQLAISDVRHIKPRLLLLFWHLADRWGRMSRDGVAIPLRLTHEVIAQLVGAQRPTVSTALQALAREGLLTRAPDRTWLLDPRSAQEDGQGRMLLSLRNASPARPAIRPVRNGLSRSASAPRAAAGAPT